MKKYLSIGLVVGAILVCGTMQILARGGHGGQQTSDETLKQTCAESYHIGRVGHRNWSAHHCMNCPPGECGKNGETFVENVFFCSPANCRRHH